MEQIITDKNDVYTATIEINSDSLDSFNLKLAAAVELAETLKEIMGDTEANFSEAMVSVGFDDNGRPYKTTTYHKKEAPVEYSPTININSCVGRTEILDMLDKNNSHLVERLQRMGKI